MHRLKRTVLFISMMAQPQQVITGHRPDYIAFFFLAVYINHKLSFTKGFT